MDDREETKSERREKKRKKQQEMKKSGQGFAALVKNAIRKRAIEIEEETEYEE